MTKQKRKVPGGPERKSKRRRKACTEEEPRAPEAGPDVQVRLPASGLACLARGQLLLGARRTVVRATVGDAVHRTAARPCGRRPLGVRAGLGSWAFSGRGGPCGYLQPAASSHLLRPCTCSLHGTGLRSAELVSPARICLSGVDTRCPPGLGVGLSSTWIGRGHCTCGRLFSLGSAWGAGARSFCSEVSVVGPPQPVPQC